MDMKKSLLGMVVFSFAVGLLILTLWANDIRQDRKHTVLVKSPTPLFAGAAGGLCDGAKLTELQPGTNLRVRRIRYWKECATLDVILPGGGDGHIVLGDGDVLVSPPLKPN